MDGIFLRKKYNINLYTLFFCGLFFIGMYVFINIVDPLATQASLVLLIMGIVACLIVIPSWLLNLGAFFHIDETSIHAKYHWFGKIDCTISQVSFVSAGLNTLIIELKNGKRHTIMGIENSRDLCFAIRRKMDFDVSTSPEKLVAEINVLKAAKKKGVIRVCVGLGLMFINIFLAVLLTAGKELSEFGRTDWLFFLLMGVIEIATTIATFYFAHKTGKYNLPIEKLHYIFRIAILETTPVPPGNAISVFVNENYTGRITLFGFPHEDSIYYTVEEFADPYTFRTVYESEIYENIEQLPGDLEELIDITEKVLR